MKTFFAQGLRARPAAAGLALALALAAVPAHAEPREADRGAKGGASTSGSEREDLTALRVRFARARALESAGRWADALEILRELAAAKPTPAITFHVGLCLDALGRLREAERTYLAARDEARGKSPLVEREASRSLADLAARTPRVVIGAYGKPRGVEFAIDGVPVPSLKPVRLDPGPHVVTAERDGQQIAAAAFAIAPREMRFIAVPIRLPAEARR